MNSVKIAVFGRSNVGKSTLLTRVFSHPYYNGARLKLTNDPKDTVPLSAAYSKLVNNEGQAAYPAGNRNTDSRNKEYNMLLADKNGDPIINVDWFDYPGGWFEKKRKKVSHSDKQRKMMRNLLFADVGILCLDGEKILTKGGKVNHTYIAREVRRLCALFKEFGYNKLWERIDEKDEFPDWVKRSPFFSIPERWILLVTKSDVLMGESTTAQIVWNSYSSNRAEVNTVFYDQYKALFSEIIFASSKFGHGIDLTLYSALYSGLKKRAKSIEKWNARKQFAKDFLSFLWSFEKTDGNEKHKVTFPPIGSVIDSKPINFENISGFIDSFQSLTQAKANIGLYHNIGPYHRG